MYKMDKTSFITSETNAQEHVATVQTDRETMMNLMKVPHELDQEEQKGSSA